MGWVSISAEHVTRICDAIGMLGMKKQTRQINQHYASIILQVLITLQCA